MRVIIIFKDRNSISKGPNGLFKDRIFFHQDSSPNPDFNTLKQTAFSKKIRKLFYQNISDSFLFMIKMQQAGKLRIVYFLNCKREISDSKRLRDLIIVVYFSEVLFCTIFQNIASRYPHFVDQEIQES